MQNNMFVGNIAKKVELSGTGKNAVCRVCLIADEYAGKDTEGKAKEKTVAIWFVAFRNIAETIATHSMIGDQLIVNYQVENNNYQKNGEEIYSYNFIINSFRFGAAGKARRKEHDIDHAEEIFDALLNRSSKNP